MFVPVGDLTIFAGAEGPPGAEPLLPLHARATRNTGVAPEEIAEVLLRVGASASVPAANHALKLAKQTLAETEEQP